MALDNLDCPQFVDFTSVDTFNICDGADYFFDKLMTSENFNQANKMLNFDDEDYDENEKKVIELLSMLSIQNSVQKPKQCTNQNREINVLTEVNTNTTKVYATPCLNQKRVQIKNTPILLEQEECGANNLENILKTIEKIRACSTSKNREANSKQNENTNAQNDQSNQKLTKPSVKSCLFGKTKQKEPFKTESLVVEKQKKPSNDFQQKTSILASTSRTKHHLDNAIGTSKQKPIQNQSKPIDTANRPVKRHITSKDQLPNSFSTTKIAKTNNSEINTNKTKATLTQPTQSSIRSRIEKANNLTQNTNTKPPIMPRKVWNASTKPLLAQSKFASNKPATQTAKFNKTNQEESNANHTKPKAINQKTIEELAKPRQRSADKTNIGSMSLYRGLKFIPKMMKQLETNKQPKSKDTNQNVTTGFKPTSTSTMIRQKQNLKTTNNNNLTKTNDNNLGIKKPIMTKACSMQNISCLSKSIVQQPKISGLLYTELRALKRQQFEESKKEKEMLACTIKKELEAKRMKRHEEEMKKLRQECIIKSHDIKQYKSIRIKPSEKPLTSPKTPNICKTTFKKSASLYNIN